MRSTSANTLKFSGKFDKVIIRRVSMVVLCRELSREWSLPSLEACVLDIFRVVHTSDSYSAVPPIVSNLVLCFVIATGCFLLQVSTGNYSHVDRLWSITPVLYAWNYLIVAWNRGLAADLRLVVVVLLITHWGGRLTFNFYRRGGYKWTAEDYRWEHVRTGFTNPILWHVFSLVFIAFYQHILLFLITCPLQVMFNVWENKYKSDILDNWTLWDLGLTLLFAGLLILETIADQQQYNYQEAKWGMIKRTKKKVHELPNPYNVGFCTTGLFAYSRHPNYFAEQSMWWTVYLFSVSASGSLNWTAVGAILLSLLFQSSTRLTEDITLKKYPNYAIYQQHVSKLVPMWPSTPVAKHD
ncbi:hypothetical protein H310_12046 [Aphanomyces invadans]|uniref:Steroid 5-alpha reductase C-terminal domain-containing protein n=1 Tax=Aphanomyces invadans TaxID=157072 RepID=A0A024TK76_9STRA|nr:hypothetical protein H310_12046 [Aphanomyces invadans]ETV94418.1 hypothetical protein H310_12046 [Aphanomyces invadans]|eukprot:XP_008877180.1 hypothetical protein H310_12046 [Aphanomyces invadans]